MGFHECKWVDAIGGGWRKRKKMKMKMRKDPNEMEAFG